MRTRPMGIGLLGLFALTMFYLGSCAWAQEGGNSTAANQSQVTQPSDGGVNWKGVGLGAGAVAGNILYVPAKLAYGILGGIGGAAGYALTGGNKQVANSIWRSSLGGDYVLTPDMMTGKEPIYFSGPSNSGTTAGSQINSSPASESTPNTPTASLSKPAIASDPGSASAAAGPENPPITHPVDNGAGLVSTDRTRTIPYAGGNNQDSTYSGGSQPASTKRSRLSDSSIE
jgi:hypothetical protein